jgi:hypothetical protein
MTLTLDGNGTISGLGDIDGHDLETNTLVNISDATFAAQAVGRATLFIDASTNTVGINTTTPAAAVFLEVADGTDPIVSLNNTSNGEVRLGCTATGGYIGTESNNQFDIEVNSASKLRIATNGNIGLGNLDTNYTLDITKNFAGENSVAIFNNVNSGTVARASLKIGYDSSAHLEIYRLGGSATIYYDTKQPSSSHNFLIAGSSTFTVSSDLLRYSGTSNRYAEIDTTNTGGGYVGFKSAGTSYLDIGDNNQLYGTDSGEGDGGGINGRPGYSLSLGSGNNCKAYFPGDSSAPLVLTSNCTGIDFSGSQGAGASSNLLDDYEEGTWTPSFTINGTTAGINYVNPPSGSYVKIGRFVSCYADFRFTNKGTSSGAAGLNGLPFTVAEILPNTALEGGGLFTYMSQVSLPFGGPITILPSNNSTSCALYFVSNATGSMTGLQGSNLTNTSDFRLTFSYQTD